MEKIKTVSSGAGATAKLIDGKIELMCLTARLRRMAKKSGNALQFVAARMPGSSDQWMLVCMPPIPGSNSEAGTESMSS